MKKILSFVMALAMVTSLVATPKVALPNKPAKKARTELTLPAVQKQQPQVKHVAKKHVVRKAGIKKAAMANTAVTLDPATQTPQTAETDIEFTISGINVAYHGTLNAATASAPADFRIYGGKTLTLSSSSNIVSVKIAGKANKDGFTLSVDKGTITTGASYEVATEKATLDDPLIVVDNINATSVVLTMGKQVRAYMIEVTVGGDVPPTPPSPTGDVEIQGLVYADAYYIDGYWDFDIYADDATDYFPEVYFSCFDEAPSQTSIVGTYDVYWAGYWASENDSVLTADQAVGSLTVTCVEQGVYNFVGSLEGEDGKTYTWNAQNIEVQAWDDEDNEITLTDGGEPTPPTPSDTIYTIMNHPMVMDSIADFGWVYVSGQNDDYSFGLQVNTDHLLGEFTNADIEYDYTMMIDWAAYDYVDIESIPSVIIAQVADTLRFTVTVKATDGQVYVITLNDFVSQPTGEETYVDIMLPEVSDATETEGWFQAMGYDVTGEYYASLCVNTTNMFGTFGDADMDWEYTGLYIGETSVQLVENSISVTVFNVGDTVVYRAEVLDVEGMKWIITMKDFTPTPTEVIDFVTVEAQGEYYAEYGDYYAMGETAGGDQIALDIYMDKLASGTFTLDDVDTYYSYIVLADGTLVEFYSADITLTVSGSDVLIEAVIIGRDVKQYNVTMLISGGQPSGDHTIVIADYADVNFTTLDNAYTVATGKNGGNSDPTYNSTSLDLRLYAKNTLTLTSNNGAMTEIVFNISEKGLARQADIAVSAGEITSYDMTNAKVTWKGNATEVVFTVGDKATHGSDGESKAGQFDFTSIDIVGAYSGLQDLQLNNNVKKFMYNGNVMINVNGVIYNVMGAKVAR